MLWAALCAVLALSGNVVDSACRVVETPEGVFTVPSLSTRAGPPPALAGTSGGIRWAYDSLPAERWIAESVALGNWGSEVMGGLVLNQQQLALFSGYDADPPTPLLIEFHGGAQDIEVAAARDDVTMAAVVSDASGVRVLRYQADQASTLWTYTFPEVSISRGLVSVNTDGSLIAVGANDNGDSELELRIFDESSGTPIASLSEPSAATGFLRYLELSSDGTHLLVHTFTAKTRIYDVPSLALIQELDARGTSDCHSISGDGAVVATGWPESKLFEWDAGTSQYLLTHTISGIQTALRGDLSDDGSTYAIGVYDNSAVPDFRVVSFDVPTKTVLFDRTFSGTGDYQNAPYDVEASQDGSRFVVGVWGDRGKVTKEINVFERTSSTPILEVARPGSVFSVDLDRDGLTTVAGSKAIHANVSGNSGSVTLVEVGGRTLEWTGVPRAGNSGTLTVHGPPGDSLLVFAALDLLDLGLQLGPCGGLFYLDPASMRPLIASSVGGAGTTTFNGTFPASLSPGLRFALQTVTFGSACNLTNPVAFQIVP